MNIKIIKIYAVSNKTLVFFKTRTEEGSVSLRMYKNSWKRFIIK